MKTLNIAISEKQFVKYGFPKEQLTFDEFVKLLKKDLAQEALRKCREIARKSGYRVLQKNPIVIGHQSLNHKSHEPTKKTL